MEYEIVSMGRAVNRQKMAFRVRNIYCEIIVEIKGNYLCSARVSYRPQVSPPGHRTFGAKSHSSVCPTANSTVYYWRAEQSTLAVLIPGLGQD
jgi:hypothetical protein